MAMIPQYNTKLFTDVWNDVESFKIDVKDSPLYNIKDESLDILYYLLYAKYGNSPIANLDEEQFKFKVFSVIFEYGPSWEKRLEIQKRLRELTDEEITLGSKAINNHAYNPSTEPSTSSVEELLAINEQSSQTYKKSKLEAYGNLWNLIATDVTQDFINKFKICFKQFVMPENPVLYTEEED